jgi:peptidoglycan/LPS O-acetylase OafA/YrhL
MSPTTLDLLSRTKAESGTETPSYSVHLDAIRGGAALIVFLTHLRYIFLGSSESSSDAAGIVHSAGQHLQQPAGVTDLGHKAVMAFFVLSGYFVGGSVLRSLRQGKWSWKRYLLQRTSRLWVVLLPALLLGLLVDGLGSRLFPDSIYGGPAGQFILTPGLADRMGGSVFLGNLFFLQTILVKQFGTNVALWSLANEFWYYLAFPLLVLILVRRQKAGLHPKDQKPVLGGPGLHPRDQKLVLGGPGLRIVSAVVLAALLFFVGEKIALYFVIWLLGVVVGLLPLRIPERLQPVFISLALLGVATASLLLKYRERNHFQVDVVIGLLCFLLVYCLLHRTRAAAQSLYRTAAHFVAKMSYSLYLVNLPLLFLANAMVMRPWHRWSHSPLHFLAAGGIAVSIFLLAYLFHLCFEARTDQVRHWLMEHV